MTLRPLSEPTTASYPRRSARWSRVCRALRAVRRFGAVASSSALIALSSGCYSSTPPGGGGEPLSEAGPEDSGLVFTDGGPGDGGGVEGDGGPLGDGDVETAVDATVPARTFESCEIDYRMAGDIAVPEYPFACSVELTEDAPLFSVPMWEFGQGCEAGDEASWATFELAEPARVAVSFPNGSWGVNLDLYAPDGSHVVQLTPERPCVTFEAEAGTWALAVTVIEPIEGETHWFEVAVDFVEAE